jgi:hypothetical protein
LVIQNGAQVNAQAVNEFQNSGDALLMPAFCQIVDSREDVLQLAATV